MRKASVVGIAMLIVGAVIFQVHLISAIPSSSQTAVGGQWQEEKPCSYYNFLVGSTIDGQNCDTGAISFTGTDIGAVVNSEIGITSTLGAATIVFGPGTFLQSTIISLKAQFVGSFPEVTLMGAGMDATVIQQANSVSMATMICLCNTSSGAGLSSPGNYLSIQSLTLNFNGANQGTKVVVGFSAGTSYPSAGGGSPALGSTFSDDLMHSEYFANDRFENGLGLGVGLGNGGAQNRTILGQNLIANDNYVNYWLTEGSGTQEDQVFTLQGIVALDSKGNEQGINVEDGPWNVDGFQVNGAGNSCVTLIAGQNIALANGLLENCGKSGGNAGSGIVVGGIDSSQPVNVAVSNIDILSTYTRYAYDIGNTVVHLLISGGQVPSSTPGGALGVVNQNSGSAVLSGISGYSPVNKVSSNFLIGGRSGTTVHYIGSISGNSSTEIASTDYIVTGVMGCFFTSANSSNSNNAIVVKDGAGNTVSSPGSTMTALWVPQGYKINWGAFTGTAGAMSVYCT